MNGCGVGVNSPCQGKVNHVWFNYPIQLKRTFNIIWILIGMVLSCQPPIVACYHIMRRCRGQVQCGVMLFELWICYERINLWWGWTSVFLFAEPRRFLAPWPDLSIATVVMSIWYGTLDVKYIRNLQLHI